MVKTLINDFSENTYIIHNEQEAYIIDPGSNTTAMIAVIEEENLTIKGVLLTHGHYDHISGVNRLLETYDAPIYIHKSERDFLFDPSLNLSQFMEQRFKIMDKHHVHTIDEGDTFTLSGETIHVYHTPGHTRGGVSFTYKHMLFSGDCLFKGSIGRTDLPTGDKETIIKSAQRLVHDFPPNTVVYPGHGPFTTFAHERTHNPFL